MTNSVIMPSIESVLKMEPKDYLDPNYISVFDVWYVYKNIEEREKFYKNRMIEEIDSILRWVDKRLFVALHDFDYANMAIELSIHAAEWIDFSFYRKSPGNFCVLKKSGIIYNLDEVTLLSLIGGKLEKLYNHYYSIRGLKQFLYNIKSVNSYFYCNISYVKVSILIDKNCDLYAYSSSERFLIECGDEQINKRLNGREDEFAQKVLIKISDCPDFVQTELYDLRRSQIKKMEKELQDKLIKEVMEKKKVEQKKQKRRKFLKKIFPFIK